MSQTLCPCCKFPIPYNKKSFEICKICFWQDDGQGDIDADKVRGGPNHDYSLSEARQNFKKYFAMFRPFDFVHFNREQERIPWKLSIMKLFEDALQSNGEKDLKEIFELLNKEGVNYVEKYFVNEIFSQQLKSIEYDKIADRFVIQFSGGVIYSYALLRFFRSKRFFLSSKEFVGKLNIKGFEQLLSDISEINGKTVNEIFIIRSTGDITIKFSQHHLIEIINDSTFYEPWEILLSENKRIVGLPGGDFSYFNK